jgi:hypothetical protein
MRTTVDVPTDLMRAAKARSAARGESLKDLLIRAVSAELGEPLTGRRGTTRVTLPLFGTAAGRRSNPSNADLERALSGVDAANTGQPGRHRQRPSRRRRDRG